jgi:hypothetical protein
MKATKDIFIRVRDVDYSIPPGLTGRRLSVRLSLKEVAVFLEGHEIARHRRSFVPADVVLAPAHARGLRLARDASRQLQSGDVAVPCPDVSRYDTLGGATP